MQKTETESPWRNGARLMPTCTYFFLVGAPVSEKVDLPPGRPRGITEIAAFLHHHRRYTDLSRVLHLNQ